MTRLPFTFLILPLQALIWFVITQYTNNPHVFDNFGMGLAIGAVLHFIMITILKLLEFALFRLRLNDIGWPLYGAYLIFIAPILLLITQMGLGGLPGFGLIFVLYSIIYFIFTLVLIFKS